MSRGQSELGCRLGKRTSTGVDRRFVEHMARSPTSPAPRGGRRPAFALALAASALRELLSRCVAAPSGDPAAAPVEWPRTPSGPARSRGVGGCGLRGEFGRRRVRPQGRVWASAGGRAARAVLRLAGARVDGGLRAAWAAGAARARRWVRIRSMTDACVRKATIRVAPWNVGHASGSTSQICGRRSAVGSPPTGGWARSAPAVGRGRSRAARRRWRATPAVASPAVGWHTSQSTAW